jgi:RNA polymerase sigma factor (sigma-70 family)
MQVDVHSDHVLIGQYLTGNEQALECLIARHKDKVFTSIYFIVRDQALAEDVFQDTFIKVIDTLRSGKYKEEGKFLPWVMRIAYNLCIDHFRRKKRTPAVTTSDGQDLFNLLDFADSNAEDDVIRDQTRAKVRQLIDQLPEEQREVVVLRHYAELSFKDIAEMTGVSINTALGRMRYALINMRKMIVEKNVHL